MRYAGSAVRYPGVLQETRRRKETVKGVIRTFRTTKFIKLAAAVSDAKYILSLIRLWRGISCFLCLLGQQTLTIYMAMDAGF